MNRLITNLLILLTITAGVMGFGLVGQASAAPPKCYSELAGGLVPCNDGDFGQKVKAQNLTLEDDKCYEFVMFGSARVVGFADCSAGRFQGEVKDAPATQLDSPKFVKNDCQKSTTLTQGNCGIIRYLVIFINLLSALVGVVVVAMIIIGGIQYSSAGDDPQKVAAAKSKITSALLALIVFIFMYAFLQWLVPGGVF